MEGQRNTFPSYKLVEDSKGSQRQYLVLCGQEVGQENKPQSLQKDFSNEQITSNASEGHEVVYVKYSKVSSVSLKTDSFIRFTKQVGKQPDYLGVASSLLCSAYKFSRKSKVPSAVVIYLDKNSPQIELVVDLAEAKMRSQEWANGRGDIEGVPAYFVEAVNVMKAKYPKIEVTTIKGEALLKEGFRLMHAVGRASCNEPIFINFAYKGNQGEKWTAFVGKGVCFDSGGLDIKSASSMLPTFLDKHGATSVLSAFETVVKQQLPINLTCSMGFVQNSISQNAYRPSDIIKSRKGLTVEIGNTDAEGRLVLADCMNWTQEKFDVKVMIELSTLTGAVMTALGTSYAGAFTNDKLLVSRLTEIGREVGQQIWEMPVNTHFKNMVKSKVADLTNSSGKAEGGACQAAAFLSYFVEINVKWVHLDIAAVSCIDKEGNGYGARLLVNYVRHACRAS